MALLAIDDVMLESTNVLLGRGAEACFGRVPVAFPIPLRLGNLGRRSTAASFDRPKNVERLLRSTQIWYLPRVNFGELQEIIQRHFTDGLVIVVGSGLSLGEGVPGMGQLATHLNAEANANLVPALKSEWQPIGDLLNAGIDLEAALQSHPPQADLELWINQTTVRYLIPFERKVIEGVVAAGKRLRLTKFLNKVIKPAEGLPIITSNYDRLIELACEEAGFHVDSTVVGLFSGVFDPAKSLMASCRGVKKAIGGRAVPEYHPRALVLKPHGSFDWYSRDSSAVRCVIDLDQPRAIITPGLNKYRAGYSSPYDKHRELANAWIDKAAKLFVVGFGFNDDHLQTHLGARIKAGVPTIAITRTALPHVESLFSISPSSICISRSSAGDGIRVVKGLGRYEFPGTGIWDLGDLADEVL